VERLELKLALKSKYKYTLGVSRVFLYTVGSISLGFETHFMFAVLSDGLEVRTYGDVKKSRVVSMQRCSEKV
jgi:hypothetical protein